MSVNDEDVKQINTKLDSIENKVSRAEPGFLSYWIGKLKWWLLGATWLIGAVTHKFGLFHLLSQITD